MKWSVSVIAEGDRVMSIDEIVALADAVADRSGVASGIGTTNYGAQIVIDAATADEAVDFATSAFVAAAALANLPAWPVTAVDAISEQDDSDFYPDYDIATDT